MRSLLFVPANSERKITKAMSSAADVVILDLEDSVSLDEKAVARDIAAATLAGARKPGQQLYVRVNPLDSGLAATDLKAVLPARPDGIMQPKTNSAGDVQALRKIAGPDIPLIVIATETASSLFGLETYSRLNPPLAGLTWGAEDLSNALGAETSRDDNGALTAPYQLARALCLIAARAAATEPIDTVCVNFSDPSALEQECRAAVRDGFTAKMAIHPNQVERINRIFTPTAEAVANAREIIDAFGAAGNPGVVAICGQMYDRPHLERAKSLIARSQRYSAHGGK
jgi:citrate lyase subunit beta/citryl-CoA lyase